MVGYNKFHYVRSQELMLAYRTLPCQHCGAEDGTVCGAHSNASIHGKGRGIKASDEFCAALCFFCHRGLDQGATMNEDERRAMWHAAHIRTVQALVILKRWPKKVRVPSLDWPKEWT